MDVDVVARLRGSHRVHGFRLELAGTSPSEAAVTEEGVERGAVRREELLQRVEHLVRGRVEVRVRARARARVKVRVRVGVSLAAGRAPRPPSALRRTSGRG